ncbi:MAG: preprotein translocase subunit SecE [Oscillospiraceae bacterium]|nr:preprotein translocase subunit SecE [Oscillospiraceae bacterium]
MADNKAKDAKNANKDDAKKALAKKEQKKKLTARMVQSVKDMKGEIKKIVWPSRKTVLNNTVVVIAVMLLSAAVVGGLDYVLMLLVNLFLRGA